MVTDAETESVVPWAGATVVAVVVTAALMVAVVTEAAGLLPPLPGVGMLGALAVVWLVLGRRLLRSEHRRRHVEEEAELTRVRDAERAHEARNALNAIEGATRVLQAGTDGLAQEERAALAEAVSTEIARLQRLVAGPPAEPELGRFRLIDAIAAVVTCERWLGAAIEVAVPEDLVAVGSPTSTAEVVQNLLQNARRHGAGPVRVWAEGDGREVVLHVRDHGPGIPAGEADVVFERGGRGHAARDLPGSGLGLHVARELMRTQGGRLWLDDGPDDAPGGACFAVALPGFTAARTLYALPRPLADGADGDTTGVETVPERLSS